MAGSSADWLVAVAAARATPEEHAVCTVTDLGGHELALLDFDPATAERFRLLGRLVEIPDAPGVRTALAISGSAAQARIHPYPADADFFERVHLQAPARAAATRKLGDLVRENALTSADRPELRLIEVYFGRHPSAGGAIRWTPTEVRTGVAVRTIDGVSTAIEWNEAADDPAFVKLDWLLQGPALGGPGKISKVIDATWERPDGTIESLDGLIDGDFQQVYLSAEDAVVAAHLVEHAAPDRGRTVYVQFMEREIAKYLRQTPPDYVKVAKRLYNRCRLTGDYDAAVWLRDLFDDDTTELVKTRVTIELVAEGALDDTCRAMDATIAVLYRWAAGRPASAPCQDFVISIQDRIAATAHDAPDAAILTLDRLLVEAIIRDFGERLLGHPPVATLLEEILRTAGATGQP